MHPNFIIYTPKKIQALIPVAAALLLGTLLTILQPLGFSEIVPEKKWVLTLLISCGYFTIYSVFLLLLNRFKILRTLRANIAVNGLLYLTLSFSAFLVLKWKTPIALYRETTLIVLVTFLVTAAVQIIMFYASKQLVKIGLKKN